MSRGMQRIVAQPAERDLRIGLGAAIFLAILRAFVLIASLGSDAPGSGVVAAQMTIELLAVAGCSYALFRRKIWGAIGLLVVWGVGYFYSWYAQPRLLPPLGIIGILVWYGLYRGLRGARALGKHAAGSAVGV
jgi:hypothetical protein